MNSFILDTPLLNLDDQPIFEQGQAVTLSKILAQTLMASQAKEPLKFGDWAKVMHKTGKIDLDNADLKKLVAFVNESTLSVLVKWSLLNILDSKPSA